MEALARESMDDAAGLGTLQIKTVIVECPRGHRETLQGHPFSVILDGQPQSRRVLCRLCYVEWINEHCGACVVDEEPKP